VKDLDNLVKPLGHRGGRRSWKRTRRKKQEEEDNNEQLVDVKNF
jgi:hypothetical protein